MESTLTIRQTRSAVYEIETRDTKAPKVIGEVEQTVAAGSDGTLLANYRGRIKLLKRLDHDDGSWINVVRTYNSAELPSLAAVREWADRIVAEHSAAAE